MESCSYAVIVIEVSCHECPPHDFPPKVSSVYGRQSFTFFKVYGVPRVVIDEELHILRSIEASRQVRGQYSFVGNRV